MKTGPNQTVTTHTRDHTGGATSSRPPGAKSGCHSHTIPLHPQTAGRNPDFMLIARSKSKSLYVDPERWGSGIGRCLITAGCAQLTSQGYGTASLWVLSGNDRVRRFYERAGWHCDGTERTDSIGDHAVREVRYQRALQTSLSRF